MTMLARLEKCVGWGAPCDNYRHINGVLCIICLSRSAGGSGLKAVDGAANVEVKKRRQDSEYGYWERINLMRNARDLFWAKAKQNNIGSSAEEVKRYIRWLRLGNEMDRRANAVGRETGEN